MEFDTIQLKRIAFILMLIDHVALYIPDLPIYFRWLGRISMPLFLFCCVCGFDFTHDRKKYIFRLYVFSLITAVVQSIYNIDNNFILTVFSVVMLLEVIELSKINRSILFYYCVWQIAALVVSLYFIQTSNADMETICFYIIPALTGSIFCLEGGFVYVILGVLFYYFKSSKRKLALCFLLFDIGFLVCSQFHIFERLIYKLPYITINGIYSVWDILLFLTECMGFSQNNRGDSLLFQNYQWMMIFSLPFLLLYNGKSRKIGKAEKMFYYWGYPLHLIILNSINI